jgi:hypothetical protein
MFAKFFSSQKDASGKRYGGYFFSSKKARDNDDIDDNDTIDIDNNNNNDNNTVGDDSYIDDDDESSTCIRENNYLIRTNKIDTKGTYYIKYEGDDQTQLVLRNTTVHKFHDGSMKKIIDIDHVYVPTLINNLFSQSNEGTNDDDTSIKTQLLRNIVEKGDILVMINRTMVYDMRLDDVTNMMAELTESGKS